jgi:AraC-like DNA-binding protein
LPPPFTIGITPVSLIFIVGAIQAWVIACALWNKSLAVAVPPLSSPINIPNNYHPINYNPNRFIAALVFILGAMLFEHFLEVTGYFYYAPALIGVLEPLHFLIGPLLYFYVKTLTSPSGIAYRQVDVLHLLPFFLAVALYAPFILSNAAPSGTVLFYAQYYLNGLDVDARVHWDGLVHSSVIFDLHNFQPGLKHELKGILGVLSVYFLALNIDWYCIVAMLGGYFISCFRLLRKHQTRIRELVANTDDMDLLWFRNFLLFMLVIAAAFVLQVVCVELLETTGIRRAHLEDLVRILISALVLHLGYKALKQPEIFSPALAGDKSPRPVHESDNAHTGYQNSPAQAKTAEKQSKYQHSSMPADLSETLANDVVLYVEREKPYLDNNLSLPELAKQVGLSTHHLSQLINESLGHSFFDFINQYRVEWVKTRLQTSYSSGESILNIAMESGFNSKSSFYAAFKKRTNMTPSQWLKTIKGVEHN